MKVSEAYPELVEEGAAEVEVDPGVGAAVEGTKEHAHHRHGVHLAH